MFKIAVVESTKITNESKTIIPIIIIPIKIVFILMLYCRHLMVRQSSLEEVKKFEK